MYRESPLPEQSANLGPEPRWFIYVAAIICASFFSNLVVGGVDAGFLRLLGDSQIDFILIQSVVTGVIAGAVWGLIFKWAVRLKLKFVIPVILIFSAVTLLPAFFTLADLAGQVEGGEEIFVMSLVGTGLHLALFWAVFLSMTVPPRRRLHA